MKLAVCCYVASRGASSNPYRPGTIIQQGDTLQVTGSEQQSKVDSAGRRVINPTEESDFVVLGTAIFLAS